MSDDPRRAAARGRRLKVLRMCAGFDVLPRDDCLIPQRCQDRQCSGCHQTVHYDPMASIPLLGEEVILCVTCLESCTSEDLGEVGGMTGLEYAVWAQRFRKDR